MWSSTMYWILKRMNNIAAVKVEGVAPDTFKLLHFFSQKVSEKNGFDCCTGEIAVTQPQYTEHESVRFDCCLSTKHAQGRGLREWLRVALAKEPWFKTGPPK